MSGRPQNPFRVASAVAWILLIAASFALLAISWGKWSYALVDSGREWIVPDGLSRGELLYRDVIYWFPPLTPYLHAGLFRLLGSNFAILALAGCLTAAGSIAALSFALRRVTGRREAFLWCAIAVAALVFMGGGGGAIIGMGFRIWQAAALTLCAATLASRGRRDLATALGVGALSGLAGLCRTEWGLASLAACLLAIGVRRSWRGAVKPWLAATAGALAVFGAGIGVFLIAAGSGPVLRDGHVLLTGLPWETQRFLRNASGMHDWPGGALRMIHSAALWAVAWLLVEIAAARGRGGPWLRSRWPALAGAATAAFLTMRFLGPFPMPAFSAAPLAGAAAAAIGLRRRGPAAASLAAFGSLAVVFSYRKPFNISDWPYVAPPLLFAIVAAAGLSRLSSARAPADVRRSLRPLAVAGLAALAVGFFAFRAVTYSRDARVAIEGTSGLLREEPSRAAWLASAAETIRRSTKPGEALVVFPEGEMLNFLADRPNPLRHRLYVPGYLTDGNEPAVLEELRRARPGAVIVLDRMTGEYGRSRFGVDYGRAIGGWIEEHYEEAPLLPSRPAKDRLLLRRAGVRAGPAESPDSTGNRLP